MSKQNILQDKILPAVAKVGGNKYLMALNNGVAAIVPFMIIGSLFTLIANLPFEGWGDIIAPISGALSIISGACTGYVAVISVVSVAYQLAKELGINRLFTAFYALIAFLMSCTTAEAGLNLGNLGSGGLFTAIIVAIITCKIVELFEKKNIGIHMPKGVPDMVADSFNSIIAGGAVLLLFWLVTAVLKFDINALFTAILSPLVVGLDTLPGALLVTFISTFIWCCGINESAISGVTYPVWYALLAENTAAFAAGETATHFAAYGFQYYNMWITGTGITGGLVILMLLSKSKTYKTLGRISLLPAVFNINEPVAFGFPIVFNPVMMIPYIGTSLILTAASYALVKLSIIGPVVVGAPWTMPPIISGWILSGGDWRACVWQVAAILISVLIYYPFFKYCEKKTLADEAKEAADEA